MRHFVSTNRLYEIGASLGRIGETFRRWRWWVKSSLADWVTMIRWPAFVFEAPQRPLAAPLRARVRSRGVARASTPRVETVVFQVVPTLPIPRAIRQVVNEFVVGEATINSTSSMRLAAQSQSVFETAYTCLSEPFD